MTEVPLHVQVIELLIRRVNERREQHREKAGNGLDDRDYQRMVGRIKEATTFLEDLEQLKKGSLEELDDEEDDESSSSANRQQSRSRRT